MRKGSRREEGERRKRERQKRKRRGRRGGRRGEERRREEREEGRRGEREGEGQRVRGSCTYRSPIDELWARALGGALRRLKERSSTSSWHSSSASSGILVSRLSPRYL